MGEYKGCELPEDLLYDLDYLWIRPNGDGTFTLGLTDPAQTMAGRLQYLRAKKPGTHRKAGKSVARLESGKWAGGVPAPFDGVVLEVNPKVLEKPDYVNIDPYHDAWLVVMKPDDPDSAYANLTTGGEAQESMQAWIERYGVQCMRCQQ